MQIPTNSCFTSRHGKTLDIVALQILVARTEKYVVTDVQNVTCVFQGGVDIVRNHYNRHALVAVELCDKLVHFERHLGVKSRHRLVQK